MLKINIITLGESGVGKTSLLHRFNTGKFKIYTRSTFVDIYKKTLTVESKETDLVIWDTAGQEKYNSLIKKYFAMADGVLLVYDVSNIMTFDKLSHWLNELRKENETAEIIIVGNKSDDFTNKLVDELQIRSFAEDRKLEYMEVSAKTGENVEAVFQSLTKKILIAKGILPSPVSQQNSEGCSMCNGLHQKGEPIIYFEYLKPGVPNNKEPDEIDKIILPAKTKVTHDRSCICLI